MDGKIDYCKMCQSSRRGIITVHNLLYFIAIFKKYMRASREHLQAVSYCFDKVLPSGNSFKFIIDNKAENLPQGWTIYQHTNSEVKM